MPFLLFVAVMIVLAIMSTTPESRAKARAAAEAKGIPKFWRIAGIISWGIILLMVVSMMFPQSPTG